MNKKKRKSTVTIPGTVQSSGTTTPAELGFTTQPVEPSVEPPPSHQEEVRLDDSSSTVKEPALELEQQPGSTEFSDLQEPSKSTEPDGGDSRSIEPIIPVNEDKSPIESLQTTDPTVLPVLADVAAEIPISETQKSGIRSQEKYGDILDEDEIARREAEADQIRDEEAEISRLQSKKKLKPKEKTRLKELRANADRRAEEAEVAAKTTPPVQPDTSGAHISNIWVQQPVAESQGEETISSVTKEPVLPAEEGSAARLRRSPHNPK
ncbi:hypothetical protein UCDDA912_g05494 [Diaporthe ampelina]|uniref:Uncharacterized protein n=1 Tax=Diaporthe ampelina TaxID=1214573 RepID=A0A0G2I3I3_9PEZI|nr:hypothetical protein UCDDA912_g05494 [Diaporthe ampelina]